MFLLTYFLYSVQELSHSFIDESARAFFPAWELLAKILASQFYQSPFMKVIGADSGVLSYIQILKMYSNKPLQNAF